MKIFRNFNKKGEGEGWRTTGIYLLLGIAFLLIIYIVLEVIVKRIKNLYF